MNFLTLIALVLPAMIVDSGARIRAIDHQQTLAINRELMAGADWGVRIEGSDSEVLVYEPEKLGKRPVNPEAMIEGITEAYRCAVKDFGLRALRADLGGLRVVVLKRRLWVDGIESRAAYYSAPKLIAISYQHFTVKTIEHEFKHAIADAIGQPVTCWREYGHTRRLHSSCE